MTPRRALFVAVAVITVAWLVLIVVWNEAPFALTFDDAYYYFGIARNVAEGHGSTFDRLNSTNGYHPLWLGLAVPFYAVGLGRHGGRAGAARVPDADVRRGLPARGGLGGTSRRSVGGRGAPAGCSGAASWCTVVLVAVFVLLVANPFVVKVFVNGLESAVVLVVDAVLLWIVLKGMPAAATPLDRRPLVAMAPRYRGCCSRWRSWLAPTRCCWSATLGLWVLFEAWPLNGARVRGLVELFAPVAVTAAVYLVANWVAFGTPLQVSGLVKQAHLDGGRVLAGLGFVAVAALVFVGSFRQHRTVARHTRLPLVASFLRRTGWFGSFAILVIGYYSVLQTQQWLWYYAPAVLYAVWLLSLLVADFVSSALIEADPARSLAKALGPVAALLILPFLVAAVLQTRVFADPDLRSIQVANRDAGEWIASNLPDDAVLASWDAGVVGLLLGASGDQPGWGGQFARVAPGDATR